MAKKENVIENFLTSLEDVEEEQTFICEAKISQFIDKNHVAIPLLRHSKELARDISKNSIQITGVGDTHIVALETGKPLEEVIIPQINPKNKLTKYF